MGTTLGEASPSSILVFSDTLPLECVQRAPETVSTMDSSLIGSPLFRWKIQFELTYSTEHSSNRLGYRSRLLEEIPNFEWSVR